MKTLPLTLGNWLPEILLAMLFSGMMTGNAKGQPGSAENQNPIQRLDEAMIQYMIKDDTLRSQIRFAREYIDIYATPEDSLAGKPEFRLYRDELEDFIKLVYHLPLKEAARIYQAKGMEPLKTVLDTTLPSLPYLVEPEVRIPESPLHGVRIALDPGHTGGTMEFAEFEKKYVKIEADPDAGIPEEIAFNEGNLALATALVLKEKFEQQGAEVLITREKEGQTVFGMTFDEWMVRRSKGALNHYMEEKSLTSRQRKWWRTKAKLRHYHRMPFLYSEFRERARKINNFKPHLTLIIHYNVQEKNEGHPQTGYKQAVEDNYSMAFIQGGFMQNELNTPEQRMNFLFHTVAPGKFHSLGLSSLVVQEFENVLGVPAITMDTTLRYLHKSSVQTSCKGVFARNLAMTQLVHGPMCFGESQLQDNKQEALLLNKQDFEIDGIRTSTRILDVAEAYYRGVMKWFKTEPWLSPSKPACTTD